MDRREFVIGSTATAAALSTRSAIAQEAYPTHAVTFVNPFPPGGAVDVVGRPLAAVLEPIVKQPVVIETKAGAAGAVGAQVAANAKPDGYTLLLHITSISGFAEVDKLFGRQPKFTRADFIPIARFVADPCLHRRQRQAAVQDAQGLGGRCQEAAERHHLQFVGSLRRLAPAGRAVPEGGRASSCATCPPMAAVRR